MEKRFVILEHVQDRGYDTFEDVLPAGTTLEQAMWQTEIDWERLTDSEKKTHTIELAALAVVEREFRGRKGLFIVCEDDEEYQDALCLGYGTAQGYTPIIKYEAAEQQKETP